MREILFRGKRVSDGEWACGSLIGNKIIVEDQRCCFVIGSSLCNAYGHEVDPATICQYTGLTDKNGKRIFEGDILEHHVQRDILVNRGVVNWDEKNARWAHQLNTMNPCFYMHNPATVEIIGNIHDNPELLEEAL